ncbi:MAG: hypothetical protein AABX53_01970 [Nanoarchaeota archaeon]
MDVSNLSRLVTSGDWVLIHDNPSCLEGAFIGVFRKWAQSGSPCGLREGVYLASPVYTLGKTSLRGADSTIKVPELCLITTNLLDAQHMTWADTFIGAERIGEACRGFEEIGARLKRDPFYAGIAHYFVSEIQRPTVL